MELTVHCIVKNEDKWIWYAIQSVLPFVNKILIYDTGSTDKTVEIINSIKSSKIIFKEKGNVTRKELALLREDQIKETKTEWFLILDGDEIWPKKELLKLIDNAKSSPKNTVAVFNNVRNCIGDIFHFLPESTGHYHIKGIWGNLNIRLIKKTNNLKVIGEYPLESYSNNNGPIEKQDKDLIYCDAWYLHTTFLKRSTSVFNKTSGSFGKKKFWEQGLKMKASDIPEVFELKSELVNNPFQKRGTLYEILAFVTYPVLKLRRLR